MATFFQAGQYEADFWPHRLRNYEIPHDYKERPQATRGFTRIQSTDKGHLLPRVKRSLKNPWGNFVGTWDLPKKLPGPRVVVSTSRRFDPFDRQRWEAARAEDVVYGYTKNGRRNIRIENVGALTHRGELGSISPVHIEPCKNINSEVLRELEEVNVPKECRFKACPDWRDKDQSCYDEMCHLKKGLEEGPGDISPSRGCVRPRQCKDKELAGCQMEEGSTSDNPLTYLTSDVIKNRGKSMVEQPRLEHDTDLEDPRCMHEEVATTISSKITHDSRVPNRANLLHMLSKKKVEKLSGPTRERCTDRTSQQSEHQHKTEYQTRYISADNHFCDVLNDSLMKAPDSRNAPQSEYQVKYMHPKSKMEQLKKSRTLKVGQDCLYDCDPRAKFVSNFSLESGKNISGCEREEAELPLQVSVRQINSPKTCNLDGGFVKDSSCHPCEPDSCYDHDIRLPSPKSNCLRSSEEVLESCPPHDDYPIKPLGPLCEVPETDIADGLSGMFDDYLCVKPRYESSKDVLCCSPSSSNGPRLVRGSPKHRLPSPKSPTCDVYKFLSEKSNPPCEDTLECRVQCEPDLEINPCGSVYKCGGKRKPSCAYQPCDRPRHVDDCLAAPYQTVDMELYGPKAERLTNQTPCDPLESVPYEHDCSEA